MIRAEKLSFGYSSKKILDEISFSLEDNKHYALIGSNGAGKSTLAEIMMNPEAFLYDGKIITDDESRTGYAAQFCIRDKTQDCSVREYLSERFVENETAIDSVCEEMGRGDNIDALMEKYQKLLDLREAMDGENYESNIHKQLHISGMTYLKDYKLSQISGGEYKVLQIMREMLLSPDILILDEPDVFLDFGNLNSLCRMINGYRGILLVITHNRYLLNHCFDGILHLENGMLIQYDGNYTEYRCRRFREKLKLRKQYEEEQREIIRTQEMVNIFRKRATEMVNPDIGRTVNAKQSQLDRLKARHIEAPFIEIREPFIEFPDVKSKKTLPEAEAVSRGEAEGRCSEDGSAADLLCGESAATIKKPVLKVEDYRLEYDESLLENISFEIFEGEKIAVAGKNGTGKTSLIRDILNNSHPAVHIDENVSYACLSQLVGDAGDEDKTVIQLMRDAGFYTEEDIILYLSMYCLDETDIYQKVGRLSGGEQNLLRIALIAASDAEFLILDEPTCQLDLYAQTALEKAISEFNGTVLMVSHDFYLISNCADSVMLIEDNTMRKMRTRKFRKMVYDKYFNLNYLETDKQKQRIETEINAAFIKKDFDNIEKLCDRLEELSRGGV